MTVKYSLKFKDGKPIINWLAVLHDIRTILKADPEKRLFTVVISVLREPKTFNQLAYFNAEIVNKIITGYRDAGYNIPLNHTRAVEWVKFQIKTLPEIQFVEEKRNEITGEVMLVTKSLADASKDEASHIIDVCIKVYSEYFGIVFTTPEEYKRRMR